MSPSSLHHHFRHPMLQIPVPCSLLLLMSQMTANSPEDGKAAGLTCNSITSNNTTATTSSTIITNSNSSHNHYHYQKKDILTSTSSSDTNRFTFNQHQHHHCSHSHQKDAQQHSSLFASFLKRTINFDSQQHHYHHRHFFVSSISNCQQMSSNNRPPIHPPSTSHNGPPSSQNGRPPSSPHSHHPPVPSNNDRPPVRPILHNGSPSKHNNTDATSHLTRHQSPGARFEVPGNAPTAPHGRQESLKRDDQVEALTSGYRRSSSKSMVKPSVVRRWLVPPPPHIGVELPPEGMTLIEKKAVSLVSREWEKARVNFKPPLTPEEEAEYSDRAKLRYLRARDMNPKLAHSMMVKSVIFRRKMLGELKPRELAKYNQTGAIYRRGFDVFHRPILYVRPKDINLNHSIDQVVANFVFHMDRCVDSMDKDKGIEQMVIIVDYNGYLISHQPPLALTQKCLEVFSDHYPERVSSVFVMDSPWYFKAFWAVVNPFLSERTKSKIVFASSDDQSSMDSITQLIATEQREQWLGNGSIPPPYYDPLIYWKAEDLHQRHLEEEKKLGVKQPSLSTSQILKQAPPPSLLTTTTIPIPTNTTTPSVTQSMPLVPSNGGRSSSNATTLPHHKNGHHHSPSPHKSINIVKQTDQI